MFTESKKLEIINKINNIGNKKHKKKYYINIFNIINKNNVKYTNNLNGVFFNLNNLDDKILLEIDAYLNNIDKIIENSDTEESITTDN